MQSFLRSSVGASFLQRAAPLPLAPCTCSLGIRGSKKTPRKYRSVPRKPPSTKPVGFADGERQPRQRLAVAQLLQDLPAVGKKDERVLVNKSSLRNRLVPRGVAAYVRNAKPVRSTSAPFAEWQPFAVRDAQVQARRDRQLTTGYPAPAHSRGNLIAENARLSAKLLLKNRERRAAATQTAYAGGRDRKARNAARAAEARAARRASISEVASTAASGTVERSAASV